MASNGTSDDVAVEKNGSGFDGVSCEATLSLRRRRDSWRRAVEEAETFGGELGSKALPHFLLVYTGYLLVIILIGAAALCAADPAGISLVDGVFMAVSAVTITGLSTINFAARPVGVHVVTWVLIMLGSPMLLSIAPVILRRLHVLHLERQKSKTLDRHSSGKSAFWGISSSQGDDVLVLTILYRTVLLYWLGGQLIGWVVLGSILRSANLGNAWDALMLSTSAWHNAGLMTLTALPRTNEPIAPWLLTCMMVMMLAGNTCFPLALRLMVSLKKRLATDSHRCYVLELLLEHPRSCYTHLFPCRQTIWLGMVTVALVLAQIAALCAVEWWAEPASGVGDSYVLAGLSDGERILATLFHAISTRNAGFCVLNLEKLSPTAAFVFMVCMWISVCPLVVAMRTTTRDAGTSPEAQEDLPWKSMVRGQLSAFMSENSFPLVGLFFLILLFEEYATTKERVRESKFIYILFEFCSAYGTSGLSMSDGPASSCGDWTSASKLCLVVVMFLGRLRGIPEAMDPAVRFQMVAKPGAPQWSEDDGSTPSADKKLEEDAYSFASSGRKEDVSSIASSGRRAEDEDSFRAVEDGESPFSEEPRAPPPASRPATGIASRVRQASLCMSGCPRLWLAV